ncbi:MAG TPA: hypothetical protein VKA84_04870, partial [Gemmatimonadaceae bacterium]|nr:hypothetical protein [Gemmatimonadaceae bacterium]
PPEIQDAIDQADVRNHSSATRIESLPDNLLGEAAPAAPPAAADGPAPPCDPTDDAAGAPPRAAEPDERDDPEPAAPALYPTLRGAAAYRPARYAVYTARYRLTLKGPDRGKWEADVRAEADAPLLTVDAVVRGVQRRAGESADSERLDGEQFRALLPEPEWSGTTSSSSTR